MPLCRIDYGDAIFVAYISKLHALPQCLPVQCCEVQEKTVMNCDKS